MLCLLWTIRMGLVSFKIYTYLHRTIYVGIPTLFYLVLPFTMAISFPLPTGLYTAIALKTILHTRDQPIHDFRFYFSRLMLFHCVTSSQSIFSFRFAHSLHFYCLRKLDFTLSTRITTHPVEMCKRLNQEHGQLNT